MKKTFFAATLIPSLIVSSSLIFASDMQLSDVSGSLDQLMKESKDTLKPPPQIGHPVQPVNPVYPVNPVINPGVGHGGNNNNNGGHNGGHNGGNNNNNNNNNTTPTGPSQADINNARNAGVRDGAEKGSRDGRREGYSDGIQAGEWEGRRRGTDDGETAGKNAGIRDGWNVDQAIGIQRGSTDGRTNGTSNGTEAGKKRCYDAGYTNGYNAAYITAKQAGLQDAASYNAGYAKGRAEAAVIEVQNGEKAGYQAGFSQRETEFENSFPDLNVPGRAAMKSVRTMDAALELPLEIVRRGYTTPEERRAYEEGYRDGYRRSYQREYEEAKRDGFNERYHNAYRWAYDAQYSVSYRNGFTEGRERGYREAYAAAYDSAYQGFYDEYSRKEYSEQRAQGLSSGQTAGNREGFAAGCAEQTKRGYKAGYEKMAAEVYPGAFSAGKQAGIAAADRYYSENAVLKVSDIAFYDENNNGSFEAGEGIMLRAELKNYGFQRSAAVTVAVKSERGEVLLASGLHTEQVNGRGMVAVNLGVGRLSDIVAPGQDALFVTFSDKGALVGEHRQSYLRVNNNKVGIVNKANAKVREKSQWLFSKKLAELPRGEKVIITDKDGNWYKVRRSDVGSGNWTEGYVKVKRLTVQ